VRWRIILLAIPTSPRILVTWSFFRPVWAIVGLSSNSERPAFSVARTLLDHGRVVIPINPRKEAAHDQRAYASLHDIPYSQRVDVVDVFVASANAGAVADDAIKRGAKAVWFQLGVSDPLVRLPLHPYFAITNSFDLLCISPLARSCFTGSSALQRRWADGGRGNLSRYRAAAAVVAAGQMDKHLEAAEPQQCLLVEAMVKKHRWSMLRL
jgi:predicted CoA-binding protein